MDYLFTLQAAALEMAPLRQNVRIMARQTQRLTSSRKPAAHAILIPVAASPPQAD